MITKELIERFFRNECSPKEQRQVMAFFKANPDEFAQYIDENEWEHFEPGEEMDAALSKKLLDSVNRQTIQKSHRTRRIYRMVAAASVIVVAGLIWIYSGSNKKDVQIAKTETANNSETNAITYHHEVNTTGKDKAINLADGSLITLSDNSEITYQLPFTNARNITLIGRALFKVAKDKTKPFTVTSGEVSTTALGTEFTVTTYKRSNRVIVRLYEGKVVIRAVDKANKTMDRDVYLLPGQEFVYGAPRGDRLHRFKPGSDSASGEIIAAEGSTHDNPSLPKNTKGNWFQFNNRPLSEVFDQLAEIYRTKIIYDKKDLKNLYFIGRYNNSDSIENILKRIGTLNHLTITNNDTAFVITR